MCRPGSASESETVTGDGTVRRARARSSVDGGRRAAYDALCAVDTDDAYLNLTLSRLLAERGMSGRDAGFATELAHGTARMQGLYDAVVGACVRGGTATLQPEVLVALRLGAHQLLSMRVPAHAAVGTTVELVRRSAGERPVRLVNAVLRRVARTPVEGWVAECAPARDADLAGHLAVRYSHPAWVVSAFLDALGDEVEVEALLEADNTAPAVTLAVRPGQACVDDLLAAGCRAGRWSPYAAVLAGGDPAAVAAVREGHAGVQDEGSQLSALLLARAQVGGLDRRWLDLCAGPGGKAALLAGVARQRDATLLAAELHEHRARLVQAGVLGYSPPSPVVVADGTCPAWGEAAFDRVLVDAPCSGLGALRRRPESRWRRTPADLPRLVSLQRRLLGSALDSVRPGGVVAYVTCSPHLRETRGVVDEVVGTRSDVVEESAWELLPEVPGTGPGPHVQLWPHRHGTDAMFIALLRRRDQCLA
ncbi:MAG: RsmB/NOP family class I SAM-dependent RNA methyltransferase [Nocardioidaceae bacterium]